MATDDLEKTLAQLEKKVSSYTTNETKGSTLIDFTKKLDIKILLMYGCIPVAIIILLIKWKPAFVCRETEDNHTLEKKVSFSKITMSVVIISLLIGGLLYMYLHRS